MTAVTAVTAVTASISPGWGSRRRLAAVSRPATPGLSASAAGSAAFDLTDEEPLAVRLKGTTSPYRRTFTMPIRRSRLAPRRSCSASVGPEGVTGVDGESRARAPSRLRGRETAYRGLLVFRPSVPRPLAPPPQTDSQRVARCPGGQHPGRGGHSRTSRRNVWPVAPSAAPAPLSAPYRPGSIVNCRHWRHPVIGRGEDNSRQRQHPRPTRVAAVRRHAPVASYPSHPMTAVTDVTAHRYRIRGARGDERCSMTADPLAAEVRTR